MSDIPLIVFAKQPHAGKVKTRLTTDCSFDHAADIAKILLTATLQKVQAWPGPLIISAWPSDQTSLFQSLAHSYTTATVKQSSGDLGEKMHAAMQQHGYPAAIIGSDAPLISNAALLQAHELLSSGENVIGPSHDGGYYLIGLANTCPAVFKDITWGSDEVLAATLKRAEFTQLEPASDIDLWADVLNARDQIPELEEYLLQQQLL